MAKRFNGKAVKTWRRGCLQFIREIRSFSLAGIFKFLLLKLRGKAILVVGSCRSCGTCCGNICLEGSDGWIRTEQTFYEIVKKHPEYQRFEVIGKDQYGFVLFSCNWRTPQGSCLDYENRLPLCSKFPESSLVFAGGRLPDKCGYSFAEVVPFEKIFRKELEKNS
ncbi:MAG: hypothetical protein WBB19_14625 [Desulforhopalus sp.]